MLFKEKKMNFSQLILKNGSQKKFANKIAE